MKVARQPASKDVTAMSYQFVDHANLPDEARCPASAQGKPVRCRATSFGAQIRLHSLLGLFRHHAGYLPGRRPPSALEEFERLERSKPVSDDFELWRMQQRAPSDWLTSSITVALMLLGLWGFVMLIVGEPSTEPLGEIVAERTDR
jgi:hypothetical protein